MGKLSRSYVHGGSEKPLIGQTLGEYFDAAAQRWASRAHTSGRSSTATDTRSATAA